MTTRTNGTHAVTAEALTRAEARAQHYTEMAEAAEKDVTGGLERQTEVRMRAWAYRQCAWAITQTIADLAR